MSFVSTAVLTLLIGCYSTDTRENAELEYVSHRSEIFGPVLTVINVDTLEEAIALVNRNKCEYYVPSSLPTLQSSLMIFFRSDGNGASIFTSSGAVARLFERTIEAGQIGVNVPIPVPLPMFAWSGNKGSVLGGHSLYGKL